MKHDTVQNAHEHHWKDVCRTKEGQLENAKKINRNYLEYNAARMQQLVYEVIFLIFSKNLYLISLIIKPTNDLDCRIELMNTRSYTIDVYI